MKTGSECNNRKWLFVLQMPQSSFFGDPNLTFGSRFPRCESVCGMEIKMKNEVGSNGITENPNAADADRVAVLKGYLKRLGNGEALQAVQKDFIREFRDVDAAEIMKAEQELLAEGMPVTEVRKLCDVHSALFHGATGEERIAGAQHQIDVNLIRQNRANQTSALVAQKGHPLRLLTRENEALSDLVLRAKECVQLGKVDKNIFDTLREVSIHYAKKGDLLYPLLGVRYGITGPSDVMWTVDDEIRDELSRLAKTQERDTTWLDRFQAVLVRIDEMIYKETNILFPNCAINFTKEEWMGIYHDQKDYMACFGIESEIWEEAEQNKDTRKPSASEQEVVLSGGHMTIEQLNTLLNTLPMEITFVDENNINRYFNENNGPKDFKRPKWQSIGMFSPAIHLRSGLRFVILSVNLCRVPWTRFRYG